MAIEKFMCQAEVWVFDHLPGSIWAYVRGWLGVMLQAKRPKLHGIDDCEIGIE
jgi:hypothetical protein